MKRVVRPDFLTPEEMERAETLWRELKYTGRFAAAVRREIIGPNLPRINAALGQSCGVMFLSTAVEYLFEQAERAGPKPGYLWELLEDTCAVCGVWIALRPRFLRSGRCDRCAKAPAH